MARRTYWFKSDLSYRSPFADTGVMVESLDEANLISSLTTEGKHRPNLDIDFPAELIPSSTPGHYHLYLNIDLTRQQYDKLIDVLEEVGIIERGIKKAYYARGMTLTRKPGVKKTVQERIRSVFRIKPY